MSAKLRNHVASCVRCGSRSLSSSSSGSVARHLHKPSTSSPACPRDDDVANHNISLTIRYTGRARESKATGPGIEENRSDPIRSRRPIRSCLGVIKFSSYLDDWSPPTGSCSVKGGEDINQLSGVPPRPIPVSVLSRAKQMLHSPLADPDFARPLCDH